MSKLDVVLSNVGDLNYKRRIKEIINYLDIQPGDKVLDCGCGDGFYTMIISELYECEIYAADNNKDLLAQAEKNVRYKHKVKFIYDNFEDGLPFESNFFDKVIFTEVLEHLDNELIALSEIKRVMKSGGRLALSVPHSNYPFLWDPLNWIRESLHLGHFNAKNPIVGGVWSYDHRRLYKHSYLVDIVEKSGLKINKTLGLSHYTAPFNLLVLYLGKQLYTRLPFPKSIKNDMEKFVWEEKKEAKRNFIIENVFNFLKKIDSKNENKNFIEEGKSFITLFCGAVKEN